MADGEGQAEGGAIVIAAPILARNDTEAARLRRSVECLSETGLPVVLADGGSDTAFVDKIAALLNIVVVRADGSGSGLVWQVRRAFEAAAARSPRWILYAEPDKTEFFQNGLAGMLEAVRTGGNFGILLPSRDAASFGTFPFAQRAAESAFNSVCGELLGQAGDYLYGPMVLNPSLIPFLTQENLGWGWRTSLLAVAHRLGMPVRLLVGNFCCPVEQRGEDSPKDRAYRLAQMEQNVAGLRHGLLVSLNSG